jgi:hypothetical protein
MEENKVEQSNHHLSTQRTGEEFWEDLMKKPYNENKAGQPYVTETFKRRLLDKKDSEKEQEKSKEV